MRVIVIRESRLDELVSTAINRLKVNNPDIPDCTISTFVYYFVELKQELEKDTL